MYWNEAFELMKQGNKIKLPSWGGYWCWDAEKQTIMIHCKPEDADKGQGPVLDIRETQRVEYTFDNIASDEWVLADEKNTPILGGIATFNFGEALKYLKRGFKVCRKGWNGKGMYLLIVPSEKWAIIEKIGLGIPKGNLLPWIGMKKSDGKFVPWLASQTDMLADDWMFFEE